MSDARQLCSVYSHREGCAHPLACGYTVWRRSYSQLHGGGHQQVTVLPTSAPPLPVSHVVCILCVPDREGLQSAVRMHPRQRSVSHVFPLKLDTSLCRMRAVYARHMLQGGRVCGQVSDNRREPGHAGRPPTPSIPAVHPLNHSDNPGVVGVSDREGCAPPRAGHRQSAERVGAAR